MTVGELDNRMSGAEFHDWQRFYNEEPWGCAVWDQRFTVLASVIGGTSESRQTFTMEQLFPRSPEIVEKTVENDQSLLSEQLKVLFTRIEHREKSKATAPIA
jgi:hypothetical protein